MITEQYKTLIRSLISTTSSGALKWGETSMKGRYEAPIKHYKVTINLVRDDGAFQVMLHDTEWATLRFMMSQEMCSIRYRYMRVNQMIISFWQNSMIVLVVRQTISIPR